MELALGLQLDTLDHLVPCHTNVKWSPVPMYECGSACVSVCEFVCTFEYTRVHKYKLCTV